MVKNKTTVIVVEDNIVYCEFVCNMLVREGFHTVQSYRLATARKLLQQASDGDIVLSDLRLPDGRHRPVAVDAERRAGIAVHHHD